MKLVSPTNNGEVGEDRGYVGRRTGSYSQSSPESRFNTAHAQHWNQLVIVLEKNRYDLASLSTSVSSAIDAVDSYNSWSVERPQDVATFVEAMDNIRYMLTYLSMVEAHQICTSSDCIRTGLDLPKQLYTDSKHHKLSPAL